MLKLVGGAILKAVEASRKGTHNLVKGFAQLYNSRKSKDNLGENKYNTPKVESTESIDDSLENIEERGSLKEEDKQTDMQNDPQYDKKMKVATKIVKAITTIVAVSALLSFTGIGFLVAMCAIAVCVGICTSLNRSVDKHHEQQKEGLQEANNLVQNTNNHSQDSPETEKTNDQGKGVKEKFKNFKSGIVDSLDSQVEKVVYSAGDKVCKIPNGVIQSFQSLNNSQDNTKSDPAAQESQMHQSSSTPAR